MGSIGSPENPAQTPNPNLIQLLFLVSLTIRVYHDYICITLTRTNLRLFEYLSYMDSI